MDISKKILRVIEITKTFGQRCAVLRYRSRVDWAQISPIEEMSGAFRLPHRAVGAMNRKLSPHRDEVDSRINYLLLATALLGTFFSGTATRIVAISMPTVAQSLGTDLLGISWALLSYQLSNIGLSVVFGRISDLWGREKIFALGFVVFATSSLLCGFSRNASS